MAKKEVKKIAKKEAVKKSSVVKSVVNVTTTFVISGENKKAVKALIKELKLWTSKTSTTNALYRAGIDCKVKKVAVAVE